MRLNRFLAAAGLCSRRKAEELIRSGLVEVAGEKITQPYFDVPENAAVRVGGKAVLRQQLVYLALNKPSGYTCTLKDPFARKKVTQLLPASLGRLFPVGRLDRDSCGLVLLTNDGYFAEKVSHPRYQVEKEYQVTVVPPFRSQDARVFLEGIEDNGEKLVARHIEVLKQLPGKTVLKLVLTEGKKREIRRMFASQRYHVLTLKRVRIGRVSLGSLKPGQYRPLKNREIQAFMRERPKPKDKEPANR